MRKMVRSIILGVLLTPITVALPASAAVITDFTLSSSHGLTGVQSILSLVQVNPESQYQPSVNVSVLVSHGTIDGFTGMFFEFINQSESPNDESVLTSIMFQTQGLLSDPHYLDYSGGTVSYTIDGGNGNGGGFGFSFNPALDADPSKKPILNGISNGEHFLLGYTIAPSTTYQNLLENLLIGGPNDYRGWTIAAHLQQVSPFPDEDNVMHDSMWLASYTDNQSSPFPPNTVVPVPAAAGLGFLGMALIGVVRRKKS